MKQTQKVVNVWSQNLRTEMKKISNFIDDYKYVAFNTEYPGIVIRPIEKHKDFNDYCYSTVRTNVNTLKIIQLSMTFYDKNGKLKKDQSTWTFNFKFDLNADIHAYDSINFLKKKLSLDFEKHRLHGIEPEHFGEYAIPSGLVLNESLTWICFHGSYDFAYLLRMLINQNIPEERDSFFVLLEKYFNSFYDVKKIISEIKELSDVPLMDLEKKIKEKNKIKKSKIESLDKTEDLPLLHNELSIITGNLFFRLKKLYLSKDTELDNWSSIYGLESKDAANYLRNRILNRISTAAIK